MWGCLVCWVGPSSTKASIWPGSRAKLRASRHLSILGSRSREAELGAYTRSGGKKKSPAARKKKADTHSRKKKADTHSHKKIVSIDHRFEIDHHFEMIIITSRLSSSLFYHLCFIGGLLPVDCRRSLFLSFLVSRGHLCREFKMMISQ